jgi:hypothetical protein
MRERGWWEQTKIERLSELIYPRSSTAVGKKDVPKPELLKDATRGAVSPLGGQAKPPNSKWHK